MFFKYTWPALVWAGIVMILTGIPGKFIPHPGSFWESLKPDKLVHVFLFGVFIFLLLYGFRRQFRFPRLQSLYLLIAWLIAAAFGGFTEILQHYVFVGRTGSFYDFFADLVGCAVGMGIFMVVRGKYIMKE